MKLILAISLMLLSNGAAIAEEWVQFKLIERPYYDKNGDILQSINGMKNRKGIDEFSGGGKVYPSEALQNEKVSKWYEGKGNLIVKMKITPEESDAIISKDKPLSYQASPKVVKGYNAKDFVPKKLTDEEAEQARIELSK